MILDEILEHKRQELERRMREVPLGRLRELAEAREPPRSLSRALSGPEVAVIAEVKRRSPSAGELDTHLDPARLAGIYAANGAAAISVLTDERYFGGTLEDLAAVRREVDVPVLRKDFVINEYQVMEARAHGADVVLLIVRALDKDYLADLLEYTRELRMEALVEVHDEAELETALDCGAPIIGVNNRDLATFHTDLEVTRRLAPLVPDEHLLVSESGIRTREQVQSLKALGVAAVLVGESLVRSGDPAAKLRELVGV